MILKKQFSFTFLLFTLALILNAQNHDIYVSDAGNFQNPPWQILKFDQDGSNGTVFIDDHLAWPQDILFIEEDNTVLISNLSSNVISKFNATTGDFIDEFATNILAPTRMKIGPDSLLYALQWTNNTKVKRYQLDGTFVDDFTENAMGTSIGLAWDSDGNLYVSSYGGGFVKKFSPTGEDLGFFIQSLSGPTNIWFDENGDFYVNEYNAARIRRFDSEGNFISIFISSVPQVEGVDFFPNGDIILGIGGASSVRTYKASGVYIEDVIPSGILSLKTPNAVRLREKTSSSTQELRKEAIFVKPNFGTKFQISDSWNDSNLSCIVVDSLGKIVHTFDMKANQKLDLSSLPNGTYFLQVTLESGKIAVQKILVQG